MNPLAEIVAITAVCVLSGCLGSLLGLGGGTFVVPILTLAFGLDMRLAIGASVISVVAGSAAASPRYLDEGFANLRVAVTLEVATVSGAIAGALLAGHLSTRALYTVFGVVLAVSAVQMLRHRQDRDGLAVPDDPIADALSLHGTGTRTGTGTGTTVRDIRPYRVTRTATGLTMMTAAGAISGLLGIGSGAMKVPAMDLAMRLPIKVSTATSNLMIGVTGAASAVVYLQRGDVVPLLAGAVALGTVVGARIGSRLLAVVPAGALRVIFLVVLLIVSVQMLLRGLA
ncbi:sulfite exporter TauE/SafE family protein [Candidatus Frankia alpina]|uniref:Probable membrane transporter protein n=1 Tax=Candidatus Frankia alpina TaxID=2699483 RepID=A0A4S5EKA0_9ACTN|nr:sulfite exporter TauE/SafE family protein [Candidatus Frankia alpina]THJ72627.1 sulfite exporter TauE/SafE family protein [Candidatus Frankia alpina]